MSIYTVLIIGAGRIGAFFDTPQSETILTHAHAFSAHPGFNLLGFVDANLVAARQAAEIWGGKAFNSIADTFSLHAVDVVVIAAPDEFHYRLLLELSAFPVKLVFTEKPLTRSVTEAKEIRDLYQNRGISLALNYTRRYVPAFANLREEIASDLFGRFLSGSGLYGKGTLHNGNHLVDLVRFLLGEITHSQTVAHTYDYYDDDPSCSAILTMTGGQLFFMQAVDCRYYTVFEMDMLFENGRIRVIDAGFSIERYEVRESTVFKGYRNLEVIGYVSTELGKAFGHAVEALHAHLLYGTALPCTGVDGLRAQQVSSAICNGIL